LHSLRFFLGVALQHASKGKLASVELVDGVLRGSDVSDGLLFQLLHVFSFRLSCHQSLEAPDFSFNPVGDVLDWVGLPLDHQLELFLKQASFLSGDEPYVSK
jgi:hypothetical protein